MLIGSSLNIQIPLLLYFSIVPIVFLATAIPITVGGLGVREGVIIYLLIKFGIDAQSAIALSLIYFGIIVFITLPGGFALLGKNKKIDVEYSMDSLEANMNRQAK